MFQKPTTPAPGSPLRKALLDTLRGPVESNLRGPVIFVVKQLSVLGDWAFIHAEPQRPGGKPVDFRKIPDYRQRIADGVFDGPTLYGLIRRQKGRWRTLAFVIGPTDVAWSDWPHEYHAPKALFPFPRN